MDDRTLDALIAYCSEQAARYRTAAAYHSLRDEDTQSAYNLGLCHAYMALARRAAAGDFTTPDPAADVS